MSGVKRCASSAESRFQSSFDHFGYRTRQGPLTREVPQSQVLERFVKSSTSSWEVWQRMLHA